MNGLEPAMSEEPKNTSLPAYALALGIEIVGQEDGVPIVKVDFGRNVEGRPGFYHGGATAGLLENAGYSALRALLTAEGREAQLKPVNITVQYLSAGKVSPALPKAE